MPRPGRQILGPVVLGVLAGVVIALRMFVPGPVGMADNGDGARLMCHFGVVPSSGTSWADLYTNHATFVYHPSARAHQDCHDYRSSSAWLMRLARHITGWTGHPGSIDLRALMVLYCVFVALLVAAVVHLFRHRPRMQVAAAVGLILVAGDSAVADYIGSPFTETAGLVGLLGIAVSAVYIARRDAHGWSRALWLLVFTLAAVLAVSAKVQTSTIAVPIAGLLVWLLVRRMPDVTRSNQVIWRVLVATSLVAVCVIAKQTYSDNPKDFATINPTEVIFVGILGHSSNPAGDLEEMGLPASLAKYAGQSWWVRDPPQQDPEFAKVKDQMTYETAARFLAKHPGRAVSIADTGAKDFWEARPDYIGNYPVGAAPGRAQECRICILSKIMQAQRPRLALLGLGFLAVATAVASILLLRRTDRRGTGHALAVTALLFDAIFVTQFVTTVYGEATENTKHLAFAILAGMLSGYLLVLAALAKQPALEPAAKPGAHRGGRSGPRMFGRSSTSR